MLHRLATAFFVHQPLSDTAIMVCVYGIFILGNEPLINRLTKVLR